MPICQIDFTEIANMEDRSDLLGSLDEQQDRIQRLFFLIKEIPNPPKVRGAPHYNYKELENFEAGKQELRLNVTKVRGN